MPNDPDSEPDPQRTEPSVRPKDYLSEAGASVELRSDAHRLYEAVTDDGSEGGSYENVRLAFRVPPEHEAEGSWTKRTSWLVYRCDVTGSKFAVPKGAPVPVLAANEPKRSGEGAWLRTKILHPDLVYDRPQLLRELVRSLDGEILDLLHELCEAFNLLSALSEMDDLPDGGAADPYPSCRGERRGYEAVGNFRPACSD